MNHQTNRFEAISSGICRHSRIALAITAVITFAIVGLNQMANTNLGPADKPLNLQQSQIVLTVGCETDLDPTCYPTAISTTELKLTSRFTVDGRDLGPTNKTYQNVCSEHHLSQGYHTARVYAWDKSGHAADTGAIKQAIKCGQVSGQVYGGKSGRGN